jgi:hypothetical protein
MTAGQPIAPVSEDSPFWEPIAFRYGDRVRVRLSPECPCYAMRTRPGAHFDGAQGPVVGRFRRQSGLAAHEIEVLPVSPGSTSSARSCRTIGASSRGPSWSCSVWRQSIRMSSTARIGPEPP